MSTDPNKWTCGHCTYENFPSATKCTMCREAKCSQLTEEIHEVEESSNVENTWSCEVCNESNEESMNHCTKCKSFRSSHSNLNEQFKLLKVTNENNTSNASQGCTKKKWICPTCTYENWPRASKCVMCLTMRKKLSPVSSQISINSPEREIFSNTRNMEDHYNRSRRLNPRRYDDRNRPISPANIDAERRIRVPRKIPRNVDVTWLNACMGILKNDLTPVIEYLSAGGDPSRQLTESEVAFLNKPSAFDVGYTLIHLAIRFKREQMLTTLLSEIEGTTSGIKRVPSYIAPDLAADIRRHFSTIIRHRKGPLPCPFVHEHTVFFLPSEIDDLPAIVQEQLFSEILDQDVQQQLEGHPPVINWSVEITTHLNSRLYALWNRSAGDCLLDSVMQATWGVFDRDNTLRHALADALTNAGHMFYPRWREYERINAMMLDFSLEETQWEDDWATLVSLANQPGSSLEQLHVFALAHILRRPIIIYGVKNVKSFRGEDIGYAKFEGVYLPLLWETNFCTKTPLALGYTRGHFSALISVEPDRPRLKSDSHFYSTFLPLMDHKRQLLPVHFTTDSEIGHGERLLRQWLDVCVTDTGLLVAQQKLQNRPLLVAQMVEEWLNYYRRLAQMSVAPFRGRITLQDFSSDGDSDCE